MTVFRLREELPASLAGKDPAVVAAGDYDPTIAPEITLFSRVPAITPQQFERIRERRQDLGPSELEALTQGSQIVVEIPAEFRSEDGRPLRFTYAVVGETESGRSETSNMVSIVPVEPPLPPQELTATATREAVELRWTAPVKGAAGGDLPTIIGYHVYRHDAANPASARTPITPTPLKETRYRDTPPYGGQVYAVTAIASVGPPRIESALSEPVTAEFRDLAPPPVPQGVVALPEDVVIQLVWESVDSPELEGYNVYRVSGMDRVKITSAPINVTVIRDDKVERGVTYTYEVTSVDRQGNESDAGRSREVIIPID